MVSAPTISPMLFVCSSPSASLLFKGVPAVALLVISEGFLHVFRYLPLLVTVLNLKVPFAYFSGYFDALIGFLCRVQRMSSLLKSLFTQWPSPSSFSIRSVSKKTNRPLPATALTNLTSPRLSFTSKTLPFSFEMSDFLGLLYHRTSCGLGHSRAH